MRPITRILLIALLLACVLCACVYVILPFLYDADRGTYDPTASQRSFFDSNPNAAFQLLPQHKRPDYPVEYSPQYAEQLNADSFPNPNRIARSHCIQLIPEAGEDINALYKVLSYIYEEDPGATYMSGYLDELIAQGQVEWAEQLIKFIPAKQKGWFYRDIMTACFRSCRPDKAVDLADKRGLGSFIAGTFNEAVSTALACDGLEEAKKVLTTVMEYINEQEDAYESNWRIFQFRPAIPMVNVGLLEEAEKYATNDNEFSCLANTHMHFGRDNLFYLYYSRIKNSMCKYQLANEAIKFLMNNGDVNRAEAVYCFLDTETRTSLASSMAVLLVTRGETEKALMLAKSIEYQENRDHCLLQIGVHLAKSGSYDAGLKVIRGIKDDFTSATGLESIACLLAKAGRMHEAKTIEREAVRKALEAKEPDGCKICGPSLSNMACAFAEAGLFDNVFLLTASVKDRLNISDIIYCAEAKIKTGQMDGVIDNLIIGLKCIIDINNRNGQPFLVPSNMDELTQLIDLFVELNQTDYIRDIMDMNSELEEWKDFVMVIESIAKNNYDDAINLLSRCKLIGLSNNAYSEVTRRIVKLAISGNLTVALRLILSMHDSGQRLSALINVRDVFNELNRQCTEDERSILRELLHDEKPILELWE